MMTAYYEAILKNAIRGCLYKHNAIGEVGLTVTEILNELDYKRTGLTTGTVECVLEWLWEADELNIIQPSGVADINRRWALV